MGNKERRVIIQVVGREENVYDLYIDNFWVVRFTDLEKVKVTLRRWFVNNAFFVPISFSKDGLSSEVWEDIYDYIMRI